MFTSMNQCLLFKVELMSGTQFIMQKGKSLPFLFLLVFSMRILCVIGNEVVVHLLGLFKEIDSLKSNGVSWKGRILISDRTNRNDGDTVEL
ncbi:Adenylosuccinate synthetase [Spatholobus suberectus]|nr:Adenylosuccinate synthetase [Spatholobus suberectus]